jgi:hypothetical protein
VLLVIVETLRLLHRLPPQRNQQYVEATEFSSSKNQRNSNNNQRSNKVMRNTSQNKNNKNSQSGSKCCKGTHRKKHQEPHLSLQASQMQPSQEANSATKTLSFGQSVIEHLHLKLQHWLSRQRQRKHRREERRIRRNNLLPTGLAFMKKLGHPSASRRKWGVFTLTVTSFE